MKLKYSLETKVKICLYNNYILFLLDAEDLLSVENGVPATDYQKLASKVIRKAIKMHQWFFPLEKSSSDLTSSKDKVFVKLDSCQCMTKNTTIL